jgi:hypothetical protein
LTTHLPSLAFALRYLPAIVFSSVALINLATLTWDYYWDGITFALQIEKVAQGEARVALLFHQNHLLYNALGYLAYRAVNLAGLSVRALYLLQVANALIGAGAVLVFFRTALRATGSLYVTLVCTTFLAFSAAWWKISTDVNAYIATILLILVCANNLLGAKPRWFIAGLALAGAMLIHQLASLFYPAALAAVFLSRSIERKVRFAAWLSATAWTPALMSYYACAYLLHGIARPVDVHKWAISNPSLKPMSSNPLEGILLLPKTNFDAILGHNFALFRRQAEWIEITIVIAATIVILVFLLMVKRKVDVLRAARTLRQYASEMTEARRQITLTVLLWIAAYVSFLLFWGPLIYFRAFYAPGISLALGLMLSNYHGITRNKPSGAAALAVVAFALLNLGFYIGPNMRANSNTRVAAARDAGKLWDQRTVVYCKGRTEADTTFEYFNPMTDWRTLARVSLDELDREIARTNDQGGSVWLNRNAVSNVDPKWLGRHSSNERIEVDPPNDPALYVRVSPEK